MNYLKHTIVSLALMGAFMLSANAAGGEGDQFMEGQMIMPSATGGVITKQLDKNMQDMVMKDAMPMTPGVMMMMHGGKMYTVTDKKMPDGKMMSEMMMRK